MLIRFVVDNVFSFGERREFNMLPNARLKTLAHHKYSVNGLELLKMTSIYGANAAGKSNMVKALSLLDNFIRDEISIASIRKNQFKFRNNREEKQMLAIEFIQDEIPFYYAIEIDRSIISSEKLYISGLGKADDQLLYERRTSADKKTSVIFHNDFEKDEKSQILKQVLIEDFIKPNKPILELLSKRDNIHLQMVKTAYDWFENTLRIIEPGAILQALTLKIEGQHFKEYAEDLMRTFDVGITSIISNKIDLNEFLKDHEGEFDDFDDIVKRIEDSPTNIVGFTSDRGEEFVFIKEEDRYYVKQLKLEHTGKNGLKINFDLEEESDGTLRLLNFVPAFQNLATETTVYIVDELERSIHSSLIKELVRKFSEDHETKGQLIFTTHESNLLDQDLFRQDEIWFAEKDNSGSTDLYSLSAFKEHKTIDIRKGYLNGRYGAIPFLSNLQDLNWHKYDTK
jgi:AAA15 family ATPase/GTPase